MNLLPRRLPRGQLTFAPLGVLADTLRHLGPPPSAGDVVRRFEAAFARSLDAPEAVALPHARVALRYLLTALALPPGSEVAMTPVTIPDIVSVVVMAGLVPVFVDLAPHTANIDADDLARKVTARTRAVLVTHLCGSPSEMERVLAVARRHGLEVLEDCSQVPGTRHRGRALGLFGRAGFLSLTPLKPVSTFHGGMTVTTDPSLARELRRLDALAPPPLPASAMLQLYARDAVLHAVTVPALFSRVTWHAVRAGEALRPEVLREFQRGNLLNRPERRRRVVLRERLPDAMYARYADLQAAAGLRALRSLDAGNARRRDLGLRLLRRLEDAGVPGLLRLPGDPAECTFWRFPLWLRDASEVPRLRSHLRARGIDSSPTNLECCSREPAFAAWAAHTPEAARFVDAMVFLPLHATLTEADMDRVAEAVASFVRGR